MNYKVGVNLEIKTEASDSDEPEWEWAKCKGSAALGAPKKEKWQRKDVTASPHRFSVYSVGLAETQNLAGWM